MAGRNLKAARFQPASLRQPARSALARAPRRVSCCHTGIATFSTSSRSHRRAHRDRKPQHDDPAAGNSLPQNRIERFSTSGSVTPRHDPQTDSVFESQEVFFARRAVPLLRQPEQLGKCPAHDHLASAFRDVTSVEHAPVLIGDGTPPQPDQSLSRIPA